MKNLFLLVVLSLTAYTSTHGQIRAGGMIGYGSEVERWGIGANAEFFLNEKMAVAPKLLAYFPEKRNGFRYSFWEIDADFHYYLLSQDVVSVYGLAGLNALFAKATVDDVSLPDEDRSDSDIGLNLGIGINLMIGNVIPFGEVKFVAGSADQGVLLLGVKFPVRD
jgi:hypothetical protein